MEGYSSDEELYNPAKQKGDVWEPEPKTIVELYEKLDKVRCAVLDFIKLFRVYFILSFICLCCCY